MQATKVNYFRAVNALKAQIIRLKSERRRHFQLLEQMPQRNEQLLGYARGFMLYVEADWRRTNSKNPLTRPSMKTAEDNVTITIHLPLSPESQTYLDKHCKDTIVIDTPGDKLVVFKLVELESWPDLVPLAVANGWLDRIESQRRQQDTVRPLVIVDLPLDLARKLGLA